MIYVWRHYIVVLQSSFKLRCILGTLPLSLFLHFILKKICLLFVVWNFGAECFLTLFSPNSFLSSPLYISISKRRDSLFPACKWMGFSSRKRNSTQIIGSFDIVCNGDPWEFERLKCFSIPLYPPTILFAARLV